MGDDLLFKEELNQFYTSKSVYKSCRAPLHVWKEFFSFSYKALWGSAGSRACSDKPLEVMSPEATSAGSEDDEV